MESGRDNAEAILEHHGIKGMRWGVRKDDGGGTAPVSKKIAKVDAKWEKSITRANDGKVTMEFHNEVVGRINRNIDALNSSDKYRNVDLSTYHGKLKDQYEKDAQETITRAFEDGTRAHYGFNASGTKRAVYDRKTDKINMVSVAAQHAAISPADIPDVTLQLHRNAKGFITSVTTVPSQIEHGEILFNQSDLDAFTHAGVFDEEAFLEHHGIKGMKWGVRRGNLQSRAMGAIDDSYQRRIATAHAVSTGQATAADIFRTATRTYGILPSKKLATRREAILTKRRERWANGHATAADVLSVVGHVRVNELVISRTDKRA